MRVRCSVRGPLLSAAGAAVLLMSLVGGLGCEIQTARSGATLTYTEDAHAAYQEALEAYEDRHWEDARALMSEVKRLFTYSRYARLAELRLGDIDFEQGKYSEAISAYRGYVRAHRGDANVEYARYRICKSLFLDINDTFLLPPQEERDQENTADAYRELRAFHKRFVDSRYRLDASYMLEVVTQRLVRHELYVARYYLNKGKFEATLLRIAYAMEHFPGSGLDAEALVLKGETLLMMHRPGDAQAVFEKVLADYGAPFRGVAQRFLDQMKADGLLKPTAPAAPAPASMRPAQVPVRERTAG